MANLEDINLGAILNDDATVQVQSVAKQLNEWGRTITNEDPFMLKVINSGTASITPPSSWAVGNAGKIRTTVAHNLGYTPIVLVYVNNPNIVGVSDYGDGIRPAPATLFLGTSYNKVIESQVLTDTNNFYIDLILLDTTGSNLTGADAYTWEYKYFVLQQETE